MDNKYTEGLLKIHNIKPSLHRIKVLQYLLERRNHPTVDMIYKELLGDIPTLSKTTLYNSLNLLVEKGIVTIITIEEGEMRYDADTSLHGHLKCIKCGQIYDISLQLSVLDISGLDKFEVQESHIYFKGLCPICLENRDEHIS
jgi:Fe2+ or Zn2+ uptake regulation protein